MVRGRVLSALDSPLLLGRRPSGPRLPGADPPGPAGSTCCQRWSGLGKPPVFFRRSVSLNRQLQESDCPLRKNSRASALASSHRSSLVRLSSRPLNHADSSSEETMRALLPGSNAITAEEMASKVRDDFCSLTSGIYIEKVLVAAEKLILILLIQVG